MEELQIFIIFGGMIVGGFSGMFWKISKLCVEVGKIKTAMITVHPEVAKALG